LAQLLYDEAEGDWDTETELGDKGFLIRTIFKYYPAGHKNRSLCAQAAAQVCLRAGYCKKEEVEVDGFAAELLQQARKYPFIRITCEENSDLFLPDVDDKN
jgi:hypothetical protein